MQRKRWMMWVLGCVCVMSAIGCGSLQTTPRLLTVPDPALPPNTAKVWEFEAKAEVCVAPDGSVSEVVYLVKERDLRPADATNLSTRAIATLREEAMIDSIAIAAASKAKFEPLQGESALSESCTVITIVFNRGRKLSLPELESMSPPEYPRLSRESGEEGLVLIRVLVSGRTGFVEDAYLIQGISGAVDSAALEAAWSAVFKPGAIGEEQVDVWMVLPIEYSLYGY